jgi:alpha-tubulin suppressor-like RCC1 family protein
MGTSCQVTGRRVLISALCALALGVIATPATSAGAATAGGSAVVPAVRPTQSDQVKAPRSGKQARLDKLAKATSRPKPTRHVRDDSLSITSSYSQGVASFRLKGRPSTAYQAKLTGGGALHPATNTGSIVTGSDGSGVLQVPVTVDQARSGNVTGAFSSTVGGVVREAAGSLWLRATKDGGIAQGSTAVDAQLKAIAHDNPTPDARAKAVKDLAQAPASETQIGATTAAVSSNEVELHGHALWTDWEGGTHPARHIVVNITDQDFFLGPSQIGQVTTDDTGFWTFSWTYPATFPEQRDYQIQFLADDGHKVTVGRDGLGDLGSYGPYSRWVGVSNVALGSDRQVDLTVGHNGVFDTAFAIHDALWTAHLFAESAGGGAEPHLRVFYPDGNDTGAFTNGSGISIGEWEWSAWDVMNHEFGHWFDMDHDITSLPGGDHCLNDHLASAACGGDGYGKDKGTQLAWSEGFADFYSVSAAHYAAVPTGLPAHLPSGHGTQDVSVTGNWNYDDVQYDSTGVFQGSFAGVSDGSDPGGYNGEDNEFSVTGILWNLESSALPATTYQDTTGFGPDYLMRQLEDSDASRLSEFLHYLWESDTSSRLLSTEEKDLGCISAEAQVAPYSVYVSNASVSTPPLVSWAAGNAEDFVNDSFIVQAIDPANGFPYFTSSTITGTSWTPTGRQWNQMAVGHGSTIQLRVTGSQTADPATGPYRGCLTPVPLAASAVLATADCAAVTLPANDDGSTGAVNLPFPVNFFGTTYSYLYVNNNGNVTFQAPLGTYTPFTITASTPPIIAAFFADVDTRGGGSAPVTYSYGATTFGGHTAFCVNWLNVGYYSGHYDKLDSFQMLLVDRSDQGTGDFDIVFNYGQMQWETGDASGGSGGFGGTPAAVGYSAGTGAAGQFFQLPGSLQTHQLTDGDPHALSTHSNTGLIAGRYQYPVRNGSAGSSNTGVVGTVTSDGFPVAGAPVQVCPHGGGQCVYQTRTGDDGTYSAVGIPAGTYDVTAYPPTGLNTRPKTVPSNQVRDGDRIIVDVDLTSIAGLPHGTTLGPLVGSGSEPMVNWQDSLTLRTAGCAGGVASYFILSLESGTFGQTLAAGGMTSDGLGNYVATIPPLYPSHGSANVNIFIDCPDGTADQNVTFDIYIDPSGTVVDQAGRPVEGATVTLLRSDAADGPFVPVPSGSDLMSPANRVTPMTTGPTGHFGWDVVAGYYRVTAAKDGCTALGGGTTASTDVLAVPPPATDLRLVLQCTVQDTTPPVIAAQAISLEGNAVGGFAGVLTGVSASDPDNTAAEITLTNNAPALLPLGMTTVTWTAVDPAGNSASATQQVTVVDTTAPRVTCPADVNVSYTPAPQLGTPTVSDIVDASPRVSNNAPTQYPLGTTTVTWTARDASGNAATCSQRVVLSVPVTTAVAGGDDHSVAVLADGTVRAWGAGGNGQLGVGTTTNATRPVVVSGLTSVRSVAAGGLFTVALRSDGTVWTWGDNSFGQLGDGTTTMRLTPRQVTGLPQIYAIAAGRYHVLAVGIDGSVWAWGANSFGQLGSTPGAKNARPSKVAGAANVVAVDAGMYHSVALRRDGSVLTWGAGYAGQLGDGTTTNNRPTPVAVAGLTGVTSIAAGQLHTMAVTGSGAVYTWGSNASGQLGDGSKTTRTRPVLVPGLGAARSVAGGDAFSLVLLRDGRVYAFGANGNGQLGDGTTTDRATAVRVLSLAGASSVAAGGSHGLAGLSGGTADSWGNNLRGQLGDGTTSNRKAIVVVSGISGVAQPSP